MTEFESTDDITIYGVTFNGVADMIAHSKSHEPKDGVWVGNDRHLYPCFDSSDWLYEDRYYWNFVFAMSEDELEARLNIVKDAEPRHLDYNKAGVVAPMVYWGGEDRHPMEFEPEALDIYPDPNDPTKSLKIGPYTFIVPANGDNVTPGCIGYEPEREMSEDDAKNQVPDDLFLGPDDPIGELWTYGYPREDDADTDISDVGSDDTDPLSDENKDKNPSK